MRVRAHRLSGVAIAAVLVLGASAQASAKTFHVTRANDPKPGACKKHDCSLREAVSAANKHKGTDVVVLKSGHTYFLQRSGSDPGEGTIDISHSLTVRASGKGRATIDGKRVDGIFEAALPGYVAAREGRYESRGELAGLRGHVKLQNLVLTHGRERFGGAGAIFCSGTLILDHTSITRNDSDGGLSAGIQAYKGLVMKNSAITFNNGAGANWGGGHASGKVVISRSKIVGNTGNEVGGLSMESSNARIDRSTIARNKVSSAPAGNPVAGLSANKLRLTRSTVSRNKGHGYGGGIFAYGRLTVEHSKFDHNQGSSGGAIDAHGATTISHSTVSSNTAGAGGAIYESSNSLTIKDSTFNQNVATSQSGAIAIYYNDIMPRHEGGLAGSAVAGRATAPVLQITGSTIAGNKAPRGGGISDYGALAKISNTTVTNNKAAYGGAIELSGGGTVVLNSATVVRNTAKPLGMITTPKGGGILNLSGTFDVGNSLVALNTVDATGTGPDCSGQFTSQGHNYLTSTDDCLGFLAYDTVSTSPLKLGQLADNGGPTKTVALRKGRPAVGKAGKSSSPKHDQRGHKRDKHPDVGAFER